MKIPDTADQLIRKIKQYKNRASRNPSLRTTWAVHKELWRANDSGYRVKFCAFWLGRILTFFVMGTFAINLATLITKEPTLTANVLGALGYFGYLIWSKKSTAK